MRDDIGGLPIHILAGASNFSNTEVMQLLLLEQGDFANAQIEPPSRKGAVLLNLTRTALRFGSTNAAIQEFATLEGSTPLHEAAKRGRSEYVALLLAMRSDPSIRNKLGQTPLEL